MKLKKPYAITAKVAQQTVEEAWSYIEQDFKALAAAQTPLEAYEALERIENSLLQRMKGVAALRSNIAFQVLEEASKR